MAKEQKVKGKGQRAKEQKVKSKEQKAKGKIRFIPNK